jgi:hypothetical protein
MCYGTLDRDELTVPLWHSYLTGSTLLQLSFLLHASSLSPGLLFKGSARTPSISIPRPALSQFQLLYSNDSDDAVCEGPGLSTSESFFPFSLFYSDPSGLGPFARTQPPFPLSLHIFSSHFCTTMLFILAILAASRASPLAISSRPLVLRDEFSRSSV